MFEKVSRSLKYDKKLFWFINIIGRAKRVPHWTVQSRFRVIYICQYVCRYVGLSTKNTPKCVGGITWSKHAHAQGKFGVIKTYVRAVHRSLSLLAEFLSQLF